MPLFSRFQQLTKGVPVVLEPVGSLSKSYRKGREEINPQGVRRVEVRNMLVSDELHKAATRTEYTVLAARLLKLAVVSYTIAESTVTPAESTRTSHSVEEPVSVHDTSNEVWLMFENTMSVGLGQVGCKKTMLSIMI